MLEHLNEMCRPGHPPLRLKHDDGDSEVLRGVPGEVTLERMLDGRDHFDPSHRERLGEVFERRHHPLAPRIPPRRQLDARAVERESDRSKVRPGEELLLVVPRLGLVVRVRSEDDELARRVDLGHEEGERVGRHEELVVVEVEDPSGVRRNGVEVEHGRSGRVVRPTCALEVRCSTLRLAWGDVARHLLVDEVSGLLAEEEVVLRRVEPCDRDLLPIDLRQRQGDALGDGSLVGDGGVGLRFDRVDKVGGEGTLPESREDHHELAVLCRLEGNSAVVGLAGTVGVGFGDGEGGVGTSSGG